MPYELVPLTVVSDSPGGAAHHRRVARGLSRQGGEKPVTAVGQASLPADYFPHLWWPMLALGYLPILALILRRPNVSD